MATGPQAALTGVFITNDRSRIQNPATVIMGITNPRIVRTGSRGGEKNDLATRPKLFPGQ
jgi:hypothetical protein